MVTLSNIHAAAWFYFLYAICLNLDTAGMGCPQQIQKQTFFRQTSHLSALKVKGIHVIFILLQSLVGYTDGLSLCTLDRKHSQFKQYDDTLQSLVLQSYKVI